MLRRANQDPSNSTAPSEGRFWTPARKTAAAAVVGLAVGAGIAGCGSDMSQKNSSIVDSFLVVANDGKGRILITDESSDGHLADNRYAWKDTTEQQTVLAGLATGSIQPLPSVHADICKDNLCPVGTIITSTPQGGSKPDKWFARPKAELAVGSDLAPGQSVLKGHAYYRVIGTLTANQVTQLNDADSSQVESLLAKDGRPVAPDAQSISFVYSPEDTGLIRWDNFAANIHDTYKIGNNSNNQALGAVAAVDQYGFGSDRPGVVEVIEWLNPKYDAS